MLPCRLARIYPGTPDTSGHVSGSRTRKTACKGGSTSGKLCYTAPVAAHAPGLDDPARYRRNGEVADDTDYHE